MKITHQRLLEVLRYSRSTGIFTWRVSTSNNMKVGDVAGGPDNRGYIKISIDGVRYYAHRLAWFYVTGKWPTVLIDHRNLNKSDNRFKNLRSADHSKNHANAPMQVNNTSGAKGVYFHKRARRWIAQITIRQVNYYLGSFKSRSAASRAYRQASTTTFKEFARAR